MQSKLNPVKIKLSHTYPMVPWLSFSVHIIVLVLACNILAASGNNETDLLALLKFKANINGDPLGVVHSWNSTLNFCHWHGVTCGRRHQRVTVLDLQSLKLSGSISPHVGNLSFLRELNLQNNSFTQAIPPQIGRLHRLQNLFMQNNSFSGEIPPNISGCSNLVTFQVQNNQLEGSIPMELGFLSKVQIIHLQRNNLTGTIPPSVGNLSSLQAMYASENNFFGRFPHSLGQLMNLTIWDLSTNGFSGTIPPSIFNLSSIVLFDVAYNQFEGSLPSEIGNTFPNIKFLSISFNNFTGSIPISISNASNIVRLQLASNKLTGKVPSKVGKLGSLGVLDVSNNMLSGKIPESLGSCNSLEVLHMDGNFFQGPIPSSFESLRGLRVLDLSRNNLSGKIAEFLQDFKLLAKLNLSYNDFEGEVPLNGVFKNARATWIKGNNKLCGGIPEFQLPICTFDHKPKKRMKTIVISIISPLLGVTLVFACFILYRSRKKRRDNNRSSSYENTLLKVSYHSLLKATNEFSSANLIGAGSFGSVYKGMHDEEGRAIPIAVKVFNLQRRGASRSFMAECEALRNIRHRNLVKVLTACSSIDHHGNDFKALVYEFMTNGSLEEWLHPTPTPDEEAKTLNLVQRINIAIDIASAIEYLHLHCETPIIHCDLKPSNILLDDEMIGRVSDFGLAKFFSEETLQNKSSSFGVRGTIGYTPPEYGAGCEISTYGDVYGYGIILLEMFTAKKPTDSIFMESLNLHNFVKIALPERVVDIVDPILLEGRSMTLGNSISNHNHNFSSIQNNIIFECLISIFEIGISCSVELPRERMNINDVVAQLSSAKKKLLKARVH
ncbi:probable LRR receptor-like serine/threonine-protein kinase At3g47570 [Hevea brasiliensis]|nr:probable LRR receptor-like serine/threonine-protein kinase At3g47570 [Hevea brasiliensis]